MKYFEPTEQNYKGFNCYKITLVEDINDCDYLEKEVTIPGLDFENNELFQLVLCYLNVVNYNLTYKESKASYGYRFKQDIYFPWLASYLEANDMIKYIENRRAHSIIYIENIIHYYNNNYEIIQLKSFKKDFDPDELIKYMNTLYNLL